MALAVQSARRVYMTFYSLPAKLSLWAVSFAHLDPCSVVAVPHARPVWIIRGLGEERHEHMNRWTHTHAKTQFQFVPTSHYVHGGVKCRTQFGDKGGRRGPRDEEPGAVYLDSSPASIDGQIQPTGLSSLETESIDTQLAQAGETLGHWAPLRAQEGLYCAISSCTRHPLTPLGDEVSSCCPTTFVGHVCKLTLHWARWHMDIRPLHSFASIADQALTRIDTFSPGLGWDLFLSTSASCFLVSTVTRVTDPLILGSCKSINSTFSCPLYVQ